MSERTTAICDGCGEEIGGDEKARRFTEYNEKDETTWVWDMCEKCARKVTLPRQKAYVV